MGPRVGRRQGWPVGPIARQRVEDICDGDDASLQRNLLAGEPARIAGAVPALVVRPRDDGGDVQQLLTGAGEQRMACLRVALHLDTLWGVERAGLSEHRVGDRDLADVVQRAHETEKLGSGRNEVERERDLLGIEADALNVCAGLAVLRFDRTAEPGDGLAVRDRLHLLGLPKLLLEQLPRRLCELALATSRKL